MLLILWFDEEAKSWFLCKIGNHVRHVSKCVFVFSSMGTLQRFIDDIELT